MSQYFPYGAQYYRTPNPPRSDWETDLRLMKSQGMNTVKLWAMWSWIHCPDDRFDFSELDELMGLCDDIGLKVLVQVILENAPAWLVAKHPDARYVANDGQAIQPIGRPNTPGGGWPGFCLDNPSAQVAAEKFMTALSRHFAGHSALFGYDVWNEVWFELDGYIGGQSYCYCDATVAKFRRYLEDRYSDICGLGQAWYRRYSCWDEVHPPHYWGGYPDWLDWIKFRLANQGDLLRWRVETLRNGAPDAALVSHGLPTTLESMCTQLTDDWRNAAEVDIYGLSCFPLWFNYDNTETFKVHDMLRGASRGKMFWTAETQAGPSGEGLTHSRSPEPDDIRLWNWTSLASGAKGVMYWQWRPELLGPESPGFGLCDLDGTPNERTRMAGSFATLINHVPEIRDSRPMRGDVAIAVLPESQIFCHISDRNAGKYAQSVRGAYRALSEAGYQVDFAALDQIHHYSLLYLPFPLMIEPQSSAELAEFVRRGGSLISEACPAQFGEGGYVCVHTPGYGLAAVFGARAASGPETVGDNPPVIHWNDAEVPCVVHRQRLVVDTARVLAYYDDGHPAIVENSQGDGRALLVTSYPGLALEWGSRDAGALIGDLAKYLGFTPRACASSPHVWVRIHRAGDSMLAFVVNTSAETCRAVVALSDDIAPIADVRDMLSGESVLALDNSFEVTVGGYDARLLRLHPHVLCAADPSSAGARKEVQL